VVSCIVAFETAALLEIPSVRLSPNVKPKAPVIGTVPLVLIAGFRLWWQPITNARHAANNVNFLMQ